MVKETPANYRIADLPANDRPRERLAELGPESLSEAELLAILLRVGIPGQNAVQLGQHLLQRFGGLIGLYQASLAQICEVKGVGVAKAAQLQAALELGRRYSRAQRGDRPAIHSPKDAADQVMYEMSGFVQENLWVLLLDTRNRLIDIDHLYQGSLNSSTVRVAEVFRKAVQISAAAIIVTHNHPSGDPTPSPEDIALTKTLVETGKLLDIQVLDHVVIGGNAFISLKERRLGFS
ncbi:MAG TPA: DNA repair protein RadC [Anaerolineaceae bacterium]|nr:DNA repair protein RadC [Anaerolineaceae bacterium]